MQSYVPTTTHPEINDRLSELYDHTYATKGLLSALGSYWTDVYADQETLAQASTGAVVALSQQFRELLHGILRSNILDVPDYETLQVDLLSFSEETAQIDSEGITFTGIEILDVDYLVSSLFEPGVVLQKGVHYTLDPTTKTLRFLVDIFNDPAITNEAWVYDAQGNITGTTRPDRIRNRKILFWGTNIVLSTTHIYERYGRFLYKKACDSDRYKWLVQALMFFYANSKSVKNIETVLNIMYGVPFAQKEGEVVLKVYVVDKNLNKTSEMDDGNYYAIETDYRTYYTWAYSTVCVQPGDVLSRFQPLATFHKVVDYLSEPDWWKTAAFPTALLEDAEDIPATLKYELLGNVLKYNLLHVTLYKTMQTMDTYDEQIDQVMELLKDSIPVYLYPIIGTVFRSHLDDGYVLPDEDNLAEALDDLRLLGKAVMSDKVLFPPIYDGSCTFGTHFMLVPGDADFEATQIAGVSSRRKTYGAGSRDYSVFYDGAHRFGDAELRHRDANSSARFDGGRVFGAMPTLLHGAQQEYFAIRRFTTHQMDRYISPNYAHAAFEYVHFDGTKKYDGTYRYRLNTMPVLEISATGKQAITDAFDISAFTESFTLRQHNVTG